MKKITEAIVLLFISAFLINTVVASDNEECAKPVKRKSSHKDDRYAKRAKEVSLEEDDVKCSQGQWSTPLKNRIAQYISQVFKIIFKGDDGAHSGTGFMFNAQLGIIVSNHHVITQEPGNLTVVTSTGKNYSHEHIEILGIMPSDHFGDIAFIRVKKLAGKFNQMPIASEHSVKLHDPVAFMGNSHGQFSVEDGNVNDKYVFALDKAVQSVQVQLLSRGGASGSPTFNAQGEINGILFGGGELYTMFCPIYFVQQVYQRMMADSVINPIWVKTLHAYFEKISEQKVLDFHKLSKRELKPYLVQKKETKRSFLQFAIGWQLPDSDAIEEGDILLAVNEQPIGCDTIALSKILDANETATLKVIRGLEIITLKIKPEIITQKFSRKITIGDMSFVSKTPAMYGVNCPLESVLMVDNGIFVIGDDSDSTICSALVNAVNRTAVTNFDEFIKAIYDEYIKEGDEHILLSLIDFDTKKPHIEYLDLTGLKGMSPQLDIFDEETRRWTKKLLTDVVTPSKHKKHKKVK